MIPAEVSKFLFSQEKYFNKSTQKDINELKQKQQHKRQFQVMSDSQAKTL